MTLVWSRQAVRDLEPVWDARAESMVPENWLSVAPRISFPTVFEDSG